MSTVREIESNARGLPVGSSHHWVKWQRSVVDQAIALRAAGMMLKAISEALGGVPVSTLHDWIAGRRRRPPERVIVKRVKKQDSFDINHQRSVPANEDQQRFAAEFGDGVDTPRCGIPSNLPLKGEC